MRIRTMDDANLILTEKSTADSFDMLPALRHNPRVAQRFFCGETGHEPKAAREQGRLRLRVLLHTGHSACVRTVHADCL